VSGVSRVEDAVVSTTSAREMPAGWGVLVRRAGRTAAWETSGSTASSRRAPWTVGCDPVMNLWDYAAVQLVVEEAGGRCTTFAGGEPAIDDSFVSTNGVLHDEVLSLLSGA
jgi:Archaeal fructose-1,6-bisphosphatase and related enzymes of inositol monophosphatase family